MSGPAVAETILAQLGGNRFRAMTGAKQFVGSETALTFKLPRGAKDGINAILIVLDANDTYTVTFYKVRGLKVATVTEVSFIYADQLRPLFTAKTGLYTSL